MQANHFKNMDMLVISEEARSTRLFNLNNIYPAVNVQDNIIFNFSREYQMATAQSKSKGH